MYDFLKDKTALYVEDELDVLKNISELLSHFFEAFYTASDGELAYKIFVDHKIDVVIVDIELPKMNGIELIKKIRQTHNNIPIIVISAYTKTDYLLDSIELKLEQYIVKPLTSKKIHTLLVKLNRKLSHENMIELVKDVYIDKNTRILFSEEMKYALSQREFNILSILAQNKIVTYDEIDALWENEIPTKNAVRSFIKYLRKKLPENLLQNRNGFGYVIERER